MLRLNELQNRMAIQKHEISQVIKPQFKQVYEKYLHSYETRTTEQIKATTQRICQLTERNLARLNSIKGQPNQLNNQKYKNCIFVCLYGLPPVKDEFGFLNIPGKTYQVISTNFQFDKDEEYRQKNLPKCSFGENAEKIHKILQQNLDKEVVFIYHSFGTFNLSVYFHKYGVERVKGLIQIGPAPIRQYMYFTEITNQFLPYSTQDIIKNKEELVGNKLATIMKIKNVELNIIWPPFPSITYATSFLLYIKSAECPIIFDLNRRFPNILKLTIFGDEDTLFERDLVCERADFYSKQQLNNQVKLKKEFQQKYKIQTSNLQDNFIFMLPKSKHSVHMQKKNKPIIAKAVQEYLDLMFK